jgi:hypothetical protein
MPGRRADLTEAPQACIRGIQKRARASPYRYDRALASQTEPAQADRAFSDRIRLSMFYTLIKKLTRFVVMTPLFFLPEERKVALERRLRGREQYRRLQQADCVVVSYGKSGRTWLRVMLSRFYQVKFGLSSRHLISFDNLHRRNPEIPKIFFTHDNYIKDYTNHTDSKRDFYDSRVILLVRHPADVAVSQYFQWRYRMKPRKKAINAYPGHGQEASVFDFVMRPESGLPKIIEFMNLWAEEIPRLKDFLLVRYEDLKSDPNSALRDIVAFAGTPGSDSEIQEAVEFGAYENMKKMEQKRSFWLSGGRMKPRDRKNPNSYKVRRAKVGGYRDYFDDDQLRELEALMYSTLSPVFGYGERPETPETARAATATP